MGIFSDFNKSIGNFINDITGVSSSAKSQNKASMAMQKDAQSFTKWQMQNAHQTEVQDLQNAGLNPVLSADGGGAGGTPAMNSAQQGVGADPISMIATIINTVNNSARTNADITNQTNKTNAEVKKINAETKNINQNTNNGGTGGTSFTRTIDWSAKKLKKANEKKDEMLKKFQEKGKSLSWADFKQKLKSR